MQIYFTCTYLLSLSISVLTIIAMVSAIVLRAVSFSTFPSALKLYAIICYIPIVFTVSIITMAYAIFYLIYDTENVAFISVANITNAYLTQMIRTFFFIFAFERIIANIYIENYAIANKVWFYWILISFNILVTALFQTVINYGPISISFKFEVYTYTVLGTYFISFFVFAVLYYLNKRMYKLTAYRISLNKRHKILENLKLLHHVFPTILIYNLFAPLGSLITAFGFWLDFPPMPVSVFHIFHNLPHLIICLRLLFINLKNNKDSKIKNVMVVKNAMGEALPKTYKANEYFKDLQQQWK